MINIKELLGLTYYTSELDQFLSDFDKKHPKLSSSQRKEKDKYDRIYRLRDKPIQDGLEHTFWDKF
mgnify:CR=1 FL=1